MTSLVLGKRPITVDDVVRVARGGRAVELAPEAVLLLERERAVVEQAAAGTGAVYGITTGLGAAVDTRIDPAAVPGFQARIPAARAVGTGPALPVETVRATMLARASCAANGGSGLRPATLDALLQALNRGFHPLVPSLGSIGEGDLPPLAAIACALMGQGEAQSGGRTLPAADALAELGLAPLVPEAKEGLALVGVNALSAGEGALAAADAAVLLRALDAQAALAIAAFGARTDPLDPAVLALRPQPGVAESAARIAALLHGGRLPRDTQPVQSPLSFRIAAQVNGAVQDLLGRFAALVETELNLPGDNPVVLAGRLVHAGNFDPTALALAAESLCLALAHASAACLQRSFRLMSTQFTGMARFLTPLGPTRTGFATVQKTFSALDGAIRHAALPVALPAIPVADQVEDLAPQAPLATAKLRRQVELVRSTAAIGLVVAAQAVDLRGEPEAWLAPRLRDVQAWVRSVVPMLEEDRPLGPSFGLLSERIEAGLLDALLLPGSA